MCVYQVAERLGHSGNLSTIFVELRNLAKYYNHTEVITCRLLLHVVVRITEDFIVYIHYS